MPIVVWTGRMEVGEQELSHGVFEVWFLTRPGLEALDAGIPVLELPEGFSGSVAPAAPPGWRYPWEPPSSLDLRLAGESRGSWGVMAVGNGGEIYLDAERALGSLGRLNVRLGTILYFEGDEVGCGGERDLVRESPGGLVLTAARYGDFAIHEYDGRIKAVQWESARMPDSGYFERPSEGLPFWTQLNGPIDLSCGLETFLILHEDSKEEAPGSARIADLGYRLERYTYCGSLVWCKRFSYGPTYGLAPPTADEPPLISFACLDRLDRIWAASKEGTIWLYSPEGELLHQTHLRELPPAHPELSGIDWFGIDSQCRVWVYKRVRRSLYDQYLVGAGYDLGLE